MPRVDQGTDRQTRNLGMAFKPTLNLGSVFLCCCSAMVERDEHVPDITALAAAHQTVALDGLLDERIEKSELARFVQIGR